MKKLFRGFFSFLNKVSTMGLVILRPAKSLLLFATLLGIVLNSFSYIGGNGNIFNGVIDIKLVMGLWISFFVLLIYTIGYKRYEKRKLSKLEYEKKLNEEQAKIRAKSHSQAIKDVQKEQNEKQL